MRTPLLATKLYIPGPRPNRVSRPRLLHQLDADLRSHHRLILLSAPAGDRLEENVEGIGHEQ